MLGGRQGRTMIPDRRETNKVTTLAPDPGPPYCLDAVFRLRLRLREGNPKLSPAVSVLLRRGDR